MPTYRHRHPRTPPAIALAGLVLALALAFGAGRPAAAQQQPQAQMLDGVAAVVNDRVITYSAVEDRMRLALLASGLPTTDESVQRLRPQVLDSLVDEQLQLQAGEDAGIQVSDDDIAEAMGVIASNNNMSTETFEALLRQHDVPLSTLHDQIRATLTWRGFVQRRVVPQVDVTEEAARDVLSRIEQVEGEPEFLLSDIFLTVDSPSEEGEVRDLAQSLVDELRGGGSFRAIASQFSDGVGATDGGNMGWVLGAQLDDDLRSTVETLGVGEVSDPVRTAGGYHIVLLRDQRLANTPTADDDLVVLGRLIIPVDPPTQQALAAAAYRLEQATSGIEGCDALQQQAEALGAPPVSSDPVRIGSLAEDLTNLLNSLDVGEPSGLIRTPGGLGIFMVCERTPADRATLDQILNNLLEERINLAQQRYLRDLRRDAMVDIRVQ
ncbi:MAG: peptidylprolyl isomerase [Rhodospirillaceae bacterium]|nr:peptidylprolyl isomerase [Rhodospirillaceae bacterium]